MFKPLEFSGEITSPRSHAEYDAELVKKILYYHFKTNPSKYWGEKVVSVVGLSTHIDTMYDQMLKAVGEDWTPGDNVAVKVKKPLSYMIATCLMLGPGVNAPLEGFSTWREKMDAIKRSHYGSDYANYPDPVGEWEEMFVQYRSDFEAAKKNKGKW